MYKPEQKCPILLSYWLPQQQNQRDIVYRTSYTNIELINYTLQSLLQQQQKFVELTTEITYENKR